MSTVVVVHEYSLAHKFCQFYRAEPVSQWLLQTLRREEFLKLCMYYNALICSGHKVESKDQDENITESKLPNLPSQMKKDQSIVKDRVRGIGRLNANNRIRASLRKRTLILPRINPQI